MKILYLCKSKKVVQRDGAILGGNANNGANDGLAYLNSNNSPANSNANIGSRLNSIIFEPAHRQLETLPLGRK